MASLGNADIHEIERFDQVSQVWWDPNGEMGTLHTINPLRVNFIMENNPLRNLKILDVGCGGGILSEALAMAGANVTGIDLSLGSIQTARQHAHMQGLEVDYQYGNVEEYAQGHADSFDVTTCMEMLEHVPYPGKIIAACAQALKIGGQAYFSGINRSLKAYFFVILAGEYILHLLPKGSHHYNNLIRPQELKSWANKCRLEFIRSSSLIYNPFTRRFKLEAAREDMNYLAHFIKRK